MSVNRGNASFITLSDEIYIGNKKIGKIYAGTTLIYPTAEVSSPTPTPTPVSKIIRCYISVYPKRQYTIGENYDWAGLVILAEYDDGHTEDVTQHFTITPASGTKTTTVGSKSIKCFWDTDTTSYTLYFTATVKAIPGDITCWIEGYPRMLYWSGQPCDWTGIVIMGEFPDGHVEDVTSYFRSSPATGTVHTVSPSSTGRDTETYTCNLSSRNLGSTTKRLSFEYKYVSRNMHRFEDLVFDSADSMLSRLVVIDGLYGKQYQWAYDIWSASPYASFPSESIAFVYAATILDKPSGYSRLKVVNGRCAYVAFRNAREKPLSGSTFVVFLDENFERVSLTVDDYELKSYIPVNSNEPATNFTISLYASTQQSYLTLVNDIGSVNRPTPLSYSFSRSSSPYLYEVLGEDFGNV